MAAPEAIEPPVVAVAEPQAEISAPTELPPTNPPTASPEPLQQDALVPQGVQMDPVIMYALIGAACGVFVLGLAITIACVVLRARRRRLLGGKLTSNNSNYTTTSPVNPAVDPGYTSLGSGSNEPPKRNGLKSRSSEKDLLKSGISKRNLLFEDADIELHEIVGSGGLGPIHRGTCLNFPKSLVFFF
jgi:hypothetical protein